jgi:hypothetical protein
MRTACKYKKLYTGTEKCLGYKWVNNDFKGPFTRAIFAVILGRFSSSEGCEGVDEL